MGAGPFTEIPTGFSLATVFGTVALWSPVPLGVAKSRAGLVGFRPTTVRKEERFALRGAACRRKRAARTYGGLEGSLLSSPQRGAGVPVGGGRHGCCFARRRGGAGLFMAMALTGKGRQTAGLFRDGPSFSLAALF